MNRGTTGVNSLPKTVTRQRRDCDLNPGSSAPESNTITTRLPSHPFVGLERAIESCLHCSHSMWSRVCEAVERPSVRLSVGLSHRSTAGAACGGFAAECRVDTGAIDRQRRQPGAQQQQRRSTALNSKCEQHHVDVER